MTTTTIYGQWNLVEPYSATFEASVMEAFGSEGPEGFDFEAIVAAYRAAINEALPDGVVLSGSEFIGPYHSQDCNFDGYPLDEDGRLNLKEIVGGIDFWKIVNQHAI